MSAPANSKIDLSPEALAALEADGTVKFTKSLPPKMVQAIRSYVAGVTLGPLGKPIFKQRLLTSSSFGAIKASWACDNWQRMNNL